MATYLGLGSNVGDRESQIRHALMSLGRDGVHIRRMAALYLTEPRDVLDQPWFVNTVAEADTALGPHALLQTCLSIEREAGRVRDVNKGPRPIDIDILLYESEVIDTPELIVPHPRYTERRFVLIPLVELQPDLKDPVRNLTMRQLLEICQDLGRVQRHAPPLQ